LGSVRQITGAAGAVQESYDYDPYGVPNMVSLVGNSVTFTGRWYDADTELYYYRSRPRP
jgi:hypothetical protein